MWDKKVTTQVIEDMQLGIGPSIEYLARCEVNAGKFDKELARKYEMLRLGFEDVQEYLDERFENDPTNPGA
jgi:hypothetical protein